MTESLREALVFVLDVFTRLYLIILLLRLILPWVGVNFQNPLSQAILRLTSPLVVPVRRIIPAIGRIDTATLLVAYLIQCLLFWVVALIYGAPVNLTVLLVTSAFALILLTINIFLFAILIGVVLSWIAPNNYNPVVGVVQAIAEPVLRPFRRHIPPVGGFDISPIFAMVALGVLAILIRGVQTEVLRLLL